LREEFRLAEKARTAPIDLLIVTAQKVDDEQKLRASFKTLLANFEPGA
jgi:hypothetical protein